MDPMLSQQPSALSLVNKTKKPLVIIIIVLVIGCFYTYLYLMNTQHSTITTFEECAKSNGGQIQESYPATCITRDGRRFVQPLSDEEKKNLLPPSPTSISNPAAFTCPPNGWISCMPILSEEGKRKCSNLDWYKTNCPNFKGAAM